MIRFILSIEKFPANRSRRIFLGREFSRRRIQQIEVEIDEELLMGGADRRMQNLESSTIILLLQVGHNCQADFI
jgi:hypothetical protein